MAIPPATSTPVGAERATDQGNTLAPGSQDGQQVTLHRGPAVVGGVAQPPLGGLLEGFLTTPMPSVMNPVIAHVQQVSRQPLPGVYFDLEAGPGDLLPVVALTLPALTDLLSDAQHNRVVELLSVASTMWQGTQVLLIDSDLLQLSYTVDDPASTGDALQLRLDVRVRADHHDHDVVEAMVIGASNEALLLPPRELRRFRGRDTVIDALVPHRQYLPLQEEALRRLDRVHHFSFWGDLATASYSFIRIGTSEGASVFDATVTLRRHAVLDAWIVAGIDAQPAPLPRLQLQPQCMDWLAGDEGGPRLPRHGIEQMRQFVEDHAQGRNLPGGVEFRTNAYGVRLTVNTLLRSGASDLERWDLRLNFVPHPTGHIVALVSLYQVPTVEIYASSCVFARPSTVDWTNPLAPRGSSGSVTTTSVRSSTTVSSGRERSPDPSEPQRNVRRRTEGNDATTQTPTARLLREQQQGFLQALQLEEAVQPPLPSTQPSPTLQGTEAPSISASSSTSGSQPNDIYISALAYRQRHGLASGVPVCPTIAAGAALGRHVPFSAMLQVNPNAHRYSSSAAQMHTLLVNFGGVTVRHAGFDQLTGSTASSVAAALRQHLQRHGHDAAVLLFRRDNRPGDAVNVVRGHHVSIFQHNAQWMLHDGRTHNGAPQPVTMDEVVQRTFSQQTQGAGELQVLSFVRPRVGAAASTAAASFPAAITPARPQGDTEVAPSERENDPTDFVAETGTGALSLADDCVTTSLTAWCQTLTGLRLNQYLPKLADGSQVDWAQTAKDLVDAGNRCDSRFRSASEVICPRLPLPSKWHVPNPIVIRATFTVQDSTVCWISLITPRDAPRSVPPGGDLCIDPATRVPIQTSALRFYAPAFQVEPRGGVPNRASTPALLLEACKHAQTVLRLGVDRQGREIREYRDVQAGGTQVHVQLRFATGNNVKVDAIRIYASDRLEPPFRWSYSPPNAEG